MLVLSRKRSEEIVVTHEATGEELVIKVGKATVSRNQFRSISLGITAPSTFKVDRREVFERKKLEAENSG